MGALSLILGDRADSNVLLNREKKCVIEGTFKSGNKKSILTFLQNNDLDAGKELVIRREIAVNGKSRAFINDTPVTLSQLQVLSSMLVDLHRQFDTLELGESGFQRQVLDALAGNESILQQYQSNYQRLQLIQKELLQLQEQKSQFNKEFDYHQFLFNELDELGFREDELEELDGELKLLSNAEGIKAALTKAFYELRESEQPVVQQIKNISQQLNPFTGYHKDLGALLDRLNAAQIELQDIASEVDHINDHIQYDPKRIDMINDRLSSGYKLLKKHGVQSTSDLLRIQEDLQNKLQAVLNIDDAISQKQKEVDELNVSTTSIAKNLSVKREKQVSPLEKQVNKLLSQVGMPNARLKVDIQQSSSLQLHGMDNIEFLFDANKSNRFEPIRKVASGGELSRLMLCIKSLVAESVDLPTMIFDEIDTGISGEAARQVGIIMKGLANARQVICITHQPQIAGKADAHFYVYKEIEADKVKTNIRQLNSDERITTIAKMLSGEKPTSAALENAREMLNN
jgi:DNA repair protein RecN (Recombination protein N)